jgi:succinate dehydrogenase / fumarate reductase flavoprotein subunit
VIRSTNGDEVPGLYAAGESACVSVHGANRLGTNSLVDLVVFGRRAGRDMARHAHESLFHPLPPQPEVKSRELISGLLSRPVRFPWVKLRDEMQRVMMDDCGVYRTGESLERARSTIARLKDQFIEVGVQDKGTVFNTGLLEVLELGNLLDLAEATVASALARTESRGAHSREDFTDRNDEQFFKHTFVYRSGENGSRVDYRDVDIIWVDHDGRRVPKYPLEIRKY